MTEFLEDTIATITDIIKIFGPAGGFFVIILESIIPILPLAAFIALNNIVFGPIVGFLISWVATVVGCLLSFYAFRLGFSKKLYRHIKIDGSVSKFMDYVSDISIPRLTLIAALPFAPAFLINIASGLSKIKVSKYIISIVIAKLSIVYFWGYIGTSLVESIRNPVILIKVVVLISLAYFVSELIQKLYNMKGVK